ncbi:MAG TPA: type II toxin-antitoxin system HicA family toxin [Candidatus Nanoarchaeia archaeon]|nr:type II toxin-antitoxin system HicA family toxin [Candidatus Nanoarchaeia archaeon]
MAKLPRLTGKELGKIVEKLGFKFDHQTGSHMIYKHIDGRRTTIPSHGKEQIGPGLLNKIIKQDLQINREEFLKYYK